MQGNLLEVADLLDPVAGLVGEFGGADQRSAGRQMRDIGCQEKFERCGLVVFRVTGLDLPRPCEVDRIHFHRSRALWLPAGRRAWTIDPPHGWPVEQTVDEYLAEREVLLEQVRAWGRDHGAGAPAESGQPGVRYRYAWWVRNPSRS